MQDPDLSLFSEAEKKAFYAGMVHAYACAMSVSNEQWPKQPMPLNWWCRMFYRILPSAIRDLERWVGTTLCTNSINSSMWRIGARK